MISNFQNNITIHSLSVKPGLTTWYAKISEITKEVLHKDCLSSITQIKNIFFDKNSFKQCFLSNEEINTINGFKVLKKQREYISSRYLIKLMIQSGFSLNIPLDQINLSSLNQGAPFLNYDPNIPLSLSHSNNYTAAVCCKNRGKTIGIDIEKIAKKPDIWFLKTAFTQKEIAHLQDNAVSIFQNWTIKEAYLKYIKKGFYEDLQKVEVINNEIWHNHNRINVDISSTLIDNNYILSIVSDI